MKIYESLAELITSRLEELGMKKSELARLTNQFPQYIGELASGTKSNPTADVIAVLATHLQVSKLEVLVAVGYLEPEVLDDPEGERLLSQFRKLPKEKQDVVKILVASLDKEGAQQNDNEIGVAVAPPKKKKKVNGKLNGTR